MAAPRSINLLPKTEFETSFWGRFLKWALTTGRYMVILTELVVIVAFMARFKLDKDLADLADNIAGKKTIIDASATYEKMFRLTQVRLASVDKLIGSQLGVANLLDLVTTRTVAGIRLTSVDITNNEILVTGTAGSDQAFGDFVARLSAGRRWKSFDLADIASDSVSGIKFNIKATL